MYFCSGSQDIFLTCFIWRVVPLKDFNHHYGLTYYDIECFLFRIVMQQSLISAVEAHISDMDVSKISTAVNPSAIINFTTISLGRTISNFMFSEEVLSKVFNKGQERFIEFFPFSSTKAELRQQIVTDKLSEIEQEWPEGGNIFHNLDTTLFTWVNKDSRLMFTSAQKGGDVKKAFEGLARSISALEESMKIEFGEGCSLEPNYGNLHSFPANLITRLRASVNMELPGFAQEGSRSLQARCEQLNLQVRSNNGVAYVISNKYRMGDSEVNLVEKMIVAINMLCTEDQDLQKKHLLDCVSR